LTTPDPILIAGAGPVGLTAACHLAEQGIPVTVLEAEPALPENLRASTFHPATLDMLARFGAAQKLIAMGLVAPTFQYRDRSGWYVTFDFGVLRGETRHPFRVQCEQYKLNFVLADRLKTYPHAQLRFGAAVTGVEQSDDSVTAIVDSGGRAERIHGRYLIGADGGRSAVRESLGIALEGFTWPERFLVVSTPFDYSAHFEHLAPVSYFADPEEWYFLLRVPGPLWRVMFPTKEHETDASILDEASIQRRLARVLPAYTPYEIRHRTLYAVHQRIAERYRAGRVFLAGDAAHLNNPLGGMGMNGGIHDALNLATKLARVWRGEADAALLDRYEAERRAIAIEYVDKITTQNKRNLEAANPAERARFRQAMEETAADPAKAKAYLLRVSMIASLRQAEASGS
jgi:3-(3-hydroxy-phenyl)propionate hydroxylase